MVLKKISSVALSAVMATTLMVPFTAMADQQPSVEYTGGNGDPITHLYLIADDANLANNNTEAWNKENAKVQVPVAINYVAQANGDIQGPSDGAAEIRNFASFAVHVENIKVTAGTNVTLAAADTDVDAADEIYLQMKPGTTGTVLSLANFTSGTGARPTAGEWNIAAAQSGVGTSSAVASTLAINSLSGKIGGFNNLNPAAWQEIGQIEWTVKPGTLSAAPALPANQAAVSTTSLADLHAIGNYLRSGNADASYVSTAEALVGATMDVTLKGNSTMMVRLSDVSVSRGLTFESVGILTSQAVNSTLTNSGGWAASSLRDSMNNANGSIFTTYFEGTTLDNFVSAVNNTSFSYGGGTNTSQNDKYWIPSMNNIYGPGWRSDAAHDDGDAQFDYYANLSNPVVNSGAADSRLVKNSGASGAFWWTRSARSGDSYSFVGITNSGSSAISDVLSPAGIAPCFCL